MCRLVKEAGAAARIVEREGARGMKAIAESAAILQKALSDVEPMKACHRIMLKKLRRTA